MDEQIERWELRSGTWLRDRVSETWRLAAIRDGTVVHPRLPAQDVARLIGAHHEPASGEWFPPDFNYSQQTGAPLHMSLPRVEFPWAPPFGAPAVAGVIPLARGLRLTPRPLVVERAQERSANSAPDRSLPPLPPGQYRFVVDTFGLAWPTLIAVEPERGSLLVLLPETQRWVALERRAGASWGQRLPNPRGWRMELVNAHGHASAYCPSAHGLAAITPDAMGLCYAIEHAGGEGPAIGGPVAWGGEIWSPVLGKGDAVQLVGKPSGAASHIVLPTHAPVPQHGFEAPVFDDLHVIWPCDEGQLILRLDARGGKHCDWIAWPEGVRPLFELGWPYRAGTGMFWQLCRRNGDGGYDYVQMGTAAPPAAPIDALRLCTGRACFRGTARLEGDPWRAARPVECASTDFVAPLLESARDGAVVGLRMDAPHGVPALLRAGNEPTRAVLQVEVPGGPALPFGTIEVKRPWLAQPFVYDGHLWVAHPELPQALGWKLAL